MSKKVYVVSNDLKISKSDFGLSTLGSFRMVKHASSISGFTPKFKDYEPKYVSQGSMML